MQNIGVNRAARAIITILALAAWAAAPATAHELQDLVEEALDQRLADVRIEQTPLRTALTELSERTGLRFALDPQTAGLMPYGERTRVSITLAGVTLREGLQHLLDGLGLAMRVEGDRLVIEPAPVLDRLGRRLRVTEVQLLQKLAANQWSELDEDTRTVQFRNVYGPKPQETLEETLRQVREPNALRQLESATQMLSWYWRPHEEIILIYSRTEDVWLRLERPVSLDYRGMRLDDVLIDLGRRVGTTILFEGGVLERIQAGERSVDLVHHNTTVLQTLERICGATGTCFQVMDYGVLIGSDETPLPPRASTARVIAVLRVPVGTDGTTVDFPFYEDNLPPEFEQLLDEKLPAVLEELRQRNPEQATRR
jgi:hypothetical protein